MNAPSVQKVAVVGVGAIGGLFAGWIGSRLPAGQIQLSAVARGETLRTLREQGLTWVDADGAEHRVAVNASDDPASLGVQDLVIVSVKGPAMPQVAPAVRALMGPHTVVLVAMNGVPWWFFDGLPGEAAGLRLNAVDPGGATAAQIPTSQVIGCVVHASAAAPTPGRIERIKNNQLIIGEPAGGVSPRVQALSDLLTQAGFGITVSERIQRDIWFKLWGNMTINPISAITGAPCDRILDDELVRGFVSAIMLEAKAIGARIGIPIDQSPEDRHAVTRKLGSFKTSMLQDVEAGRPIELDALVGAVREIGQHLGEATPNMDALMGLTRLMGQMKQLYPEPTKTP
ncbi:MAG: 2-dehydropantoate 2-reductase [Hydrogenophaga sp.]|uniref:2-dehydropantoate 2-reductase n=1 Tax=Hydrogenophaga sp. TaxID=1904254 RepID=UPI0025BC7BBF|nr:2-dehydropantoate 2-reductase [Hydrogenophaga sp.]MBT9551870.1 2-dehydropantoate 2-reductase [Hydrogenophaga sp.]